jgi:hypothetical protein
MSEREIPWSALVEGDRLKSQKTGKFYEVEQVRKMADGYHIKVAGIAKEIVRHGGPGDTTCIVQRGPTGEAVDVWFEVLSSG